MGKMKGLERGREGKRERGKEGEKGREAGRERGRGREGERERASGCGGEVVDVCVDVAHTPSARSNPFTDEVFRQQQRETQPCMHARAMHVRIRALSKQKHAPPPARPPGKEPRVNRLTNS